MRKKLYLIISPHDGNSRLSKAYDIFIMVAIMISIVPLAFKETNIYFKLADQITVSIFIVDYILRFTVCDYKLKRSALSFLIYPFTPMAIVDLISILPSITLLSNGFKLFKIVRLLRTLKVLRAFKFLRYSKSFEAIITVFQRQKRVLGAVATMAVAYILISALVIYNAEPESFKTYFDAIYWATISLTTVGYGDIYPITAVGKVITMISSLFGIAIIALPSGVITAGYLDIMKKNNDK